MNINQYNSRVTNDNPFVTLHPNHMHVCNDNMKSKTSYYSNLYSNTDIRMGSSNILHSYTHNYRTAHCTNCILVDCNVQVYNSKCHISIHDYPNWVILLHIHKKNEGPNELNRLSTIRWISCKQDDRHSRPRSPTCGHRSPKQSTVCRHVLLPINHVNRECDWRAFTTFTTLIQCSDSVSCNYYSTHQSTHG